MTYGCSDIELLAFAYLAGELEPIEEFPFHAHITTCSGCRVHIDEVRSDFEFAEQLFSVDRPTMGLRPERLTAIFCADASLDTPIEPDIALRGSTQYPFRLFGGLQRWAVAASLVVIGTLFMQNFSESGREAPQHERTQLASLSTIDTSFIHTPLDSRSTQNYPLSYGMIYPIGYRESGGYVIGDPDTVSLAVDGQFPEGIIRVREGVEKDTVVSATRWAGSGDAEFPFQLGLGGPQSYYSDETEMYIQ